MTVEINSLCSLLLELVGKSDIRLPKYEQNDSSLLSFWSGGGLFGLDAFNSSSNDSPKTSEQTNDFPEVFDIGIK